MRSIALFCVIAGLLIFIGCLGAGGGGSLGRSPIDPADTNLVSGVAFFADRQLYGGIPILARDANTGAVGGLVRTDSKGAFAFTTLPAGIYNLTATTGNGETTFYSGLQVTGQQSVQVPSTSLLGLKDLVIDRVTSSTARVTFHSNLSAISQIALGAATNRFAVSNDLSSTHQIALAGLATSTLYEVTVFMTDVQGQQFACPGFSFTTSAASGPYDMSLVLNDGAFETRSRTVTATVKAKGATQYRIAPIETFANAAWESFTTGTQRSIELPAGDGTKKVSVQFRDQFGTVSGVLTASILLSTSTDGYLGLWINGGAAVVSSREVTLTMLYPGATLMQVSNDSQFPASYWEPFTQYRRWTLLPNDGAKTVYAKFQGTNINSQQVFAAYTTLNTSLASSTGTASGTASSTPDPTEPVTDEGPFEIVIGKGAVPTTAAENLVGKTVTLMLEGDSIQVVGVFRNSITKQVYETNLKWYVNNVEGGDETLGQFNTSTNVYTTPDQLPAGGDTVTIKAVTNNQYYSGPATTSVYFATFNVNFQNFWKERRSTMVNVTGTPMSIYSLLVDPIWQPGENYWLFAGTNGNGVWFAEVPSNVIEDAATFTWLPTQLSSTALVTDASYIVNRISINTQNHDIAAATEDGVYVFGSSFRTYTDPPVQLLTGAAKSVAWDKKDPSYMYVTRDYGLDRLRLDYAGGATPNVISRTPLYLIEYREIEKRTDSNASPPVDVYAYSNKVKYLFKASPRALALSSADPNKLYFGNDAGEFGALDNVRTMNSPLQSFTNQPIFLTDTGVGTFLGNGYFLAAVNPPVPRSTVSGIVTDISIDPNSPWTLLLSSSAGVFRSTTSGDSFNSLAGNVNTRATLIDPTNVTFFFYGSENGLYRSKDAGASWTQIKSGLANHLVINCFTQSEGPAGSLRRIWVGTTGGVFAGAKSLDLY